MRPDYLSDGEFEYWLRENNINLMPHQKELALAILACPALYARWGPNQYWPGTKARLNVMAMTFRGILSGLTFTFNTVEKFIRK